MTLYNHSFCVVHVVQKLYMLEMCLRPRQHNVTSKMNNILKIYCRYIVELYLKWSYIKL